MKILYNILLLLIMSVGIYGQTINSSWVDGSVYIKLADHIGIETETESGNYIRSARQNVPLMTELEQKYRITDWMQPFYNAENDGLKNVLKVDFADATDIDALLNELKENPDVEYAEPVPLFYTNYAPNDTYYNQTLTNGANSSWFLNLINAAQAWDITTGSPEIIVAVVDNAIWTGHPDLVNKIAVQIDVADGDSNASPPATGSTNINWSHGTHVAGLVAAETNNNTGIASIGNNVKIMAVKATGDASNPRSLSAALEGMVWAANNGAHIISMSFSTTTESVTMQNIVNYAYNKGCILVAAAGNDNVETKNYPAAYSHVISVASCNENNQKSSFSNYGAWVDITAPGGVSNNSLSMLSTIFGNSNASTYGITGNYGIMQGTSMATPVVSGLCGLMLSANPHLTPEKVASLLKSSSFDLSATNPSYVNKLGAGRIDAYAAVKAAANSVSDLTADFQVNTIYVNSGNTVTFTDLSVGTPTSWHWEFENGTPATSNEQNPVVTYETAGTFKVTLTVTDAAQNSSTETKTSYIIVKGDGASAWTVQNTNVAVLSRGVSHTSIVDEDTAWILTYDGSETTGNENSTKDFSRTIDGGANWLPGTINIPDEYIPAGISAVNGQKAWIVAYKRSLTGGGIFYTQDGGQNWTQQTTAVFNGATSFANVIHMFNQNEGFCQGDPVNGKFEIYYTENGGTNWQAVTGENNPAIQQGEAGWTGSIAWADDNAWFGTNTGRVFRTTDKGKTWQAFATGSVDATHLSFSCVNNGVLLCLDDTNWKMMKTNDGGITWNQIPVTSGYLSDVSAVPGTPGMLVGIKYGGNNIQNYFSAYSFDDGNTWTQLDNAVQYTNIMMFDKETGWAGGFTTGEGKEGIYKWPELVNSETPNFTSNPVVSASGGSNYEYNITVIDFNGNNVVITASVKPDWLTLTDNGNGTAKLSGIVPENLQQNFNIYLVADNGSYKGYQNFVLTITEGFANNNKKIKSDEVIIYPNPAQNIIFVECNEGTYEIFDLTGRSILSGKLVNGNNDLDVSLLTTGSYLIYIKENEKTHVNKVIIK